MAALSDLLSGPRLPGRPRRIEVETWGGQPAAASAAACALSAAGFSRGTRRMVRYRDR